jgi:hypothetical protein
MQLLLIYNYYTKEQLVLHTNNDEVINFFALGDWGGSDTYPYR